MTNLTLRTKSTLLILFIVTAIVVFLTTVTYLVGWTMLVLSIAGIFVLGYFIINAARALHLIWGWSA